MRTIKHPHSRENLEQYIKGLIDNTYTLRQVSVFTGYTVQHLCNIKKAYKTKGSAVLVNGHKGKPAKKQVPKDIQEKIIKIYKEDFEGYNFHFFKKCLKDFYNINYCYKTIYAILIKAGFKSPESHKVHKTEDIHRPRFRREQSGDMIQIDATPYQWLNWCGDTTYYALHGAIDDAEEKITGLYMSKNECSYGYYDILEQTAVNYGIPVDIYSDRSAIFCVNPKDKDKLTVQEQLEGIHEKRTQWQRILTELHINQILAWSPQAKGRVERMWRTIQGRLPWYFKKYKIKTVEAANEFLKNNYVKIFNDEFSIKAEKKPVWRKAPDNLKNIICSKFKRHTNSAGVISFQGYKFNVKAPHCACRDIELCIFKDGLKALIDDIYYPVEIMDEITGGIGEKMSDSLKDIIYKYMFTDCKKVSA